MAWILTFNFQLCHGLSKRDNCEVALFHFHRMRISDLIIVGNHSFTSQTVLISLGSPASLSFQVFTDMQNTQAVFSFDWTWIFLDGHTVMAQLAVCFFLMGFISWYITWVIGVRCLFISVSLAINCRFIGGSSHSGTDERKCGRFTHLWRVQSQAGDWITTNSEWDDHPSNQWDFYHGDNLTCA